MRGLEEVVGREGRGEGEVIGEWVREGVKSILLPSITNGSTLPPSLPPLTSYLLLSSYLAAYSSPEEDLFNFTPAGRGRRKKKRRTGEENEEYEEGRREVRGRRFNIERLLSIFRAIVSWYPPCGSVGGRVMLDEGGEDTFLAISSLQNSGLLSQSSSKTTPWHQKNLTCCIDKQLAFQIAKQLKVPLNDLIL